VRLLELLGEAMEAVRAGADARTRLELAVVKAARPELDSLTRTLLARVERLERGPGSQPGAAPPAREAATPDARRGDPEPPRPSAVAPVAAESAGAPAPPAAAPPPAAPAHGDRADARTGEKDLQELRSAWPAVVEVVRSQNALLGALIQEARPVAVAGSEVTVAFSAGAPFLKKKAEDTANRRAVGEALASVVAGRWTLVYTLGDEPDSEDSPAPPASEEEWIKRLMQEFDAEELPPDDAASAAVGDAVAAPPASAAAGEEGG
jgi:DNA polymerase III subunit gamma/tau